MNKMKKIVLFGMLIALSFQWLNAQNRDHPMMKEREARMESMKIAYITEQLDLSPEEAQRFWPVYNAHHEAVKSIRMNEARLEKDNKLSEDQAMALIDQGIADERKMLELKEAYVQDLLEVLPATKVVQLFKAERKFKREVLDQLRKRMDKRRNMRRE
jgi:hypothetical protein